MASEAKPQFHMSEGTRAKVLASLDGLPASKRADILQAFAAVSAEIEMYVTGETFRKLRHDWSHSLEMVLNK